jgi:hypothetical protein
VEELGSHGPQAGFDVAQALAIGQLRKGHDPVVVGTAERLDLVVASVVLNNAMKMMPGKMPHHLRKNRRARVHARPPYELKGVSVHSLSSRKHPLSSLTYYSLILYRD